MCLLLSEVLPQWTACCMYLVTSARILGISLSHCPPPDLVNFAPQIHSLLLILTATEVVSWIQS
jgi:hypothetical protein